MQYDFLLNNHLDTFVAELYRALIFDTKAMWTPLRLMLAQLPRLDQASFFKSMLRTLAREYLDRNVDSPSKTSAAIAGVAGIVKEMVSNNQYLEGQLLNWLTANTSELGGLSLDARRALIATLALHQGQRLRDQGTALTRLQKNFSAYSTHP